MANQLCLILVLISNVISNEDNACNRIKIGDNCFEKEIFWSKLDRPYNLYIYKSINLLFYSYSLPEVYSDVDFQLALYNLDTREQQSIAGIRGGCSVAIDQINEVIYLGGTDGIYKYNMLTKLADVFQERGKNIWSLFYKNNLFYISYPDQKLHIQHNGKFAKVKEFEGIEIDHFYVSNSNVIYFANKTGLYKYDNVKLRAICLSEVLTVRQIVEDNEGDTYLCTNAGLYTVSKHEGLKKVIDMKNIFGLAFDRDNQIIYSDEQNIVKLKLDVAGCEVKTNQW